jgi:hypothetical protein
MLGIYPTTMFAVLVNLKFKKKKKERKEKEKERHMGM